MSKRARWFGSLLGARRDQDDQQELDRTDDLIDEVERTRRDLATITLRLADHVCALKALTALYARERQEGDSGG
jgi:hypothetical protein